MKKSLALLACAALLGLALAAGLGLSISAAPPVRATPTPGVPSPQDALGDAGAELAAVGRPDLIVSSISIDGSARLGITTTIRVVVQNVGTADVASNNNFFVDLYVDPAAPPEAGRPGEPGTLTMGVQGYLFRVGQSVPLLFQYMFTRTRSYDLYARADTDGDVVESNEDNNVFGPVVANVRTGTWVADVNHEDFQAGFSNMDVSHPLGLIALSGIYQEPVIAPNSIPYSAPLQGPTLYNPDFGVSNYAQSVNQVAPVIARNAAGHLYVAWEDGRYGEVNDRDIFFSRSTDSGATWAPDVRVNRDPGTANQRSPTMVYVSATNTIFIAWQDSRRGNYDIWLARSTDGGLSWFEPAGIPVNDDPGAAQQLNPSLTADAAGILYLVWQDRRNGNDDIYFAASADGGLHWTPNVLVTDQPASTAQAQRSPNIVATNDYIYVVWEDARSSGQGDQGDIYYSWANRCSGLCSLYTFHIDQRINNDATLLAQLDPTIARSTPRTEISRTQEYTPGTTLCTSPPPITTEVLFRAIYAGQTIHFGWQDFRNGQNNPDIYHAWMFEPFFKLENVIQVPNYNCALDEPFDPVMPNPFSDSGEILGNVSISQIPPETPAACGQPPYGQGGLPCDPPLSPDTAGDQPKQEWDISHSVQEMPAFSPGPPDSDIVYLLWTDRRNFDGWSARIYMAAPDRPIDSGEYIVHDNVIVNDNPKLLRYLQGDRYLRNAPAAVRQYRPAGTYSNNAQAPFVVWDDDRRSDPLAGYSLERNIFFARPGAPPSPGLFMSRIFEANEDTYWNLLEWWGVTPVGTRIFFQTRTGNTPWPDATWSDWTGPFWDGNEGLWIYPAPAEIVDAAHNRYPKAHYLQYRLWIKDYPAAGAPTWKPPFSPQRLPQAWVSKVVVHYSPKTYRAALPLVMKRGTGPATPTPTVTPTGTRVPTATTTPGAQRIPNDTYYANYQWNMAKIRMPEAWSQTVGSPDVLVAVLDSGIDDEHPELAAKVAGGWDFINNVGAVGDDNGHGTHVAGIVAAASNNAQGVAGVAWNAQLLSVKVLDSQGAGPLSVVAAGIVWAADHGANIINMSLGSTVGTMTLQSAIAHAHDQGALLVASAGNSFNSGNPVMYPAAYPDVIGVGATGDADEHASYSETGSFVDLTAPGGNPTGQTDANRRHWIWSTYARGVGGGNPAVGYMAIAGTSQAAPHVAGLAALIWSLNPGLNAAQVEGLMRETAVDLGASGPDNVFGYGRIDAAAALHAAAGAALAPAVAAEEPASVSPEIPADAEFVPGRILVLFRETAGAAELDSSVQAVGASVESRLAQIDWLVLSVPAGQERAIIARLRADKNVSWAEPDYLLHAM